MNGHDWVSTAGRGRPSRHIQCVPIVRSSRHDAKRNSQQNLIVLRSTNSKDWMKLMFIFQCKRFSFSVIHTHRRTCGNYLQPHISEIAVLNVTWTPTILDKVLTFSRPSLIFVDHSRLYRTSYCHHCKMNHNI